MLPNTCRGVEKLAFALFSLLISASASGQQVNRFEFVISNDVSPEMPSATIQVWAYFELQYFAFSDGRYSAVTPIDPGVFSDPKIILKQKWIDQYAGDIGDSGNSVDGVVAHQVYFELAGLHPDEANPLLLWQATWSTTDFTARDVPVWTVSSKFEVFDESNHYLDLTDEAGEASGTIHVVPGPGVSVMAAAGLGLAARRKRGGASGVAG